MAEGMCGRGHVWQGACVAGGMHGRGACMAGGVWQGIMPCRGHACQGGEGLMWQGGMHSWGCAWPGGHVCGRGCYMACMPPSPTLPPWQIL